MTTTRQVKDIWCNSSNNTIVDKQGSKGDVPSFTSKSNALLRWHIVDSKNKAVDLNGCTFTLKIGSNINTPIMTVSNSSFVLSDWLSGNLTNGLMCCRVDFGDISITTYIGSTIAKNLYFSLWATSGGVNYLLGQSSAVLRNSIKI